MPFNRNPAFWFFSLVVTLLLFEATHIDVATQQLLYFSESDRWLINRNNDLLNTIFYSGLKLVLFFGAALLLTAFFLSTKVCGLTSHRKALKVVLLSLLLAPTTILALKSTTNIACPRALTEFGGDIPYVRLFEAYPSNAMPTRRQRCFPAGHASGGFAFMSLALLFRKRRHQIGAFLSAALLGWLMGFYKMAIGDHFLSHTLVSMEISAIVISVLNYYVNPSSISPVKKPSI